MATFDKVTERARRVLIVASGPSAAGADLDLIRQAAEAGVYILGINRAWEWCPYLTGWFTLDPDNKVIKYMYQDPSEGRVKRYVAVESDYGQPDARVHYHRNMPRFNGIAYLQRRRGVGPMKHVPGLSKVRSRVHTGNGAYGGLGVAFHMDPERIGMLGVDGRQYDGYAYLDGRPKMYLHHLPEIFATTVDQLNEKGIQVRNGSLNSLVTCFPRCKPNEVIKWLMEDLS